MLRFAILKTLDDEIEVATLMDGSPLEYDHNQFVDALVSNTKQYLFEKGLGDLDFRGRAKQTFNLTEIETAIRVGFDKKVCELKEMTIKMK